MPQEMMKPVGSPISSILLVLALFLVSRTASASQPVRAGICELHHGIEFLDDDDHEHIERLCMEPASQFLTTNSTIRRLLHRGPQYYLLLSQRLQISKVHRGDDNPAERLWSWIRDRDPKNKCPDLSANIREELMDADLSAPLHFGIRALRNFVSKCDPPSRIVWDDVSIISYIHENPPNDDAKEPEVEFIVHYNNATLYRIKPIAVRGATVTLRYAVVPRNSQVAVQVLDEGMSVPWMEVVDAGTDRLIPPRVLESATVDFEIEGGEGYDVFHVVDGHIIEDIPVTLSASTLHSIQVYLQHDDGTVTLLHEGQIDIPAGTKIYPLKIPLFDPNNIGLAFQIVENCSERAINPQRLRTYITDYTQAKFGGDNSISIIPLNDYKSVADHTSLLVSPRQGTNEAKLDISREWIDRILANVESIAKLVIIDIRCTEDREFEIDTLTIDLGAHLNRQPMAVVVQRGATPALDAHELRPSLERALDLVFDKPGASFVGPSDHSQVLALDVVLDGSAENYGVPKEFDYFETFPREQIWIVGAAFSWNLPCEEIKKFNDLDSGQAQTIMSRMREAQNFQRLYEKDGQQDLDLRQIGNNKIPNRLRRPAQRPQQANQLLIAPSPDNLVGRPSGAYALIGYDNKGEVQLLAAKCTNLEEPPSIVGAEYMWGRNLLTNSRQIGHRASVHYLLPQNQHFYWSFGANYSYDPESIYSENTPANWDDYVQGITGELAASPGHLLYWNRHGLGATTGLSVNFLPYARVGSVFRRVWIGPGAALGINVGMSRLRGAEAALGNTNEALRAVDVHLEAIFSADVKAQIGNRLWVGASLSTIAGGVLRPASTQVLPVRSGFLWVRPTVGFGWSF